MIRPNAGFVVKCHQKKVRDNHEGKLFLNVVYADGIEVPTSSEASAAAGKKWSVPFALGPLRMEADKGGDLVPTFDCCFHPLSLEYARDNKAFRNLLVGIAKDAIQKSFLASGDETVLADGYTILKRVQYKSGQTPKAMMIAALGAKLKPNDANNKSSQADKSPKTGRDAPKNKEEKACPSNEAAAKMTADEPCSVTTPEYKIVESGNFEIGDHTTMTLAPISRRPKDLVVHITLDQITSVKGIDLDVSEKNLLLKTTDKSVATKYHLDLALPYPVSSKNGSAKFDKKQSKLIVTLPVIGS